MRSILCRCWLDPEKLRDAMCKIRLQSLLFVELETMMNFEARRCIHQRLGN
jgi:hypothetical protein